MTRQPFSCVNADGSPKRSFNEVYAKTYIKKMKKRRFQLKEPPNTMYYCAFHNGWHIGHGNP